MGQSWVLSVRRLLILCTLCLSLCSTALASINQGKKIISLNVTNMPRKELFNLIQKKTGLVFFYANREVPLPKTFTLSVEEKPLDEVLEIIFRGLNVEWSYSDDTILLKSKSEKKDSEAAASDSSITYPTVTGKVTAADGTAIPGAAVMVKGTTDGATTDGEGNFSIANVKRNDVLLVRSIGYEQREFAVKGARIQILLNVDVQKLTTFNVLSTGYERAPRERATGAFAYVNNELFNKRVSPDVLSRLEGNVPGLIFNKNTYASVTGGVDINIQGHSTLFSNDQPLVVVDNFTYDGDIRNINPNDIESVTILRDAAAASIWGVRSGNGVIVITTKKGSKNQKLTAELNTNLTIGEKPNLFYNPNFLKSSDYISIEQKLFDMGFYDNYLWDYTMNLTPAVQIMADAKSGKISSKDAAEALDALKKQDIRDDLRKYLYQTYIAQQYSLSVRGGGANTDYTLSFGLDKDRQNMLGNKNQRLTLNSTYNFYPTKKIQFTVGVNIVQLDNTTNGTAAQIPLFPYLKLKDNNGKDLSISNDYSIRYKDSMTNLGLLNWQYYPLQEIANADNKYKSLDNRVNIGASYDILNDLKAEIKYQYELANIKAENYYSEETYFARTQINKFTNISQDGRLTYPMPLGGILQGNNSTLMSHQGRLQLSLNKSFSQIHRITSIAGVELRSYMTESNTYTAYGYDKNTRSSNPSIDYINSYPTQPFGSDRIPNNTAFGKGTNNFLSYYANISYNLKSIYDFSFSGRIDNSNLFGVKTNQKAVPLYSIGMGYTISNANFYNLTWMPFARFRATFGYNGNINNSATAQTTIQQRDQSPIFNQIYSEIQNPGNSQLRWEKIQKTNFGFDFTLLDNRISGTFDFYLKKGIDLFGFSQLAPSTGLTTYFGNNANTTGQGFDIVLNTKTVRLKNFLWSNNIILSRAFDKVTKYSIRPNNALTFLSSGDGNAGQVIPIEGAPLFGIYSFKSAGLTHETGDPQGYLNGKESTDYTEILKNTTVDSLQYIGSSRPTIFGSLRNTFTFKGLSLSFNTIFKFNYYFRKISMSDATQFNNDYTKRWEKPGDELSTYVPSIQFPPIGNDRSTFYRYSTPLVEKADNIRIQDISLSYDISNDQKRYLPFTHLQIYGYINNIGIIWRANNSKIDPDVYGAGVGLQMPAPRTYTLGLKATL